jgi:hypothetical protein
MRFRQMATYRGVPYEAGVGPTDADVVLFAACPPPEDLGFEPAPGHWRKRVIRAEVDMLWESRPVGAFHGEPCLVLDDHGDRLHIAYLGKDSRRARELGYWQVDRGVFELLTPRDEVTGLAEETVEKGRPRRGGPAGPPLPSYPYSAQQWPPAAAAAAAAAGGSYPGEPAPAPAGAWNGAGAPAARGWNGSPGYNGTPGYNGSGPAAPGGYDGTGPLAAVGYNGTGTASPGGYNGTGPGGYNGNGTPPGPGYSGNGTPPGPGGWNGAPPAGPASWAGPGTPGPWDGAFPPSAAGGWNGTGPGGSGPGAANGTGERAAALPGRRRAGSGPGRRAARKQRVQTRSIFSELADLAAIPRSAYALEQESDGAMCLLRTDDGYEVFSASDGARHEVRSFADEEAAYFYLFGVLAAEAVRSGALVPPGSR